MQYGIRTLTPIDFDEHPQLELTPAGNGFELLLILILLLLVVALLFL